MSEESRREKLIAQVYEHKTALVWYSFGLVKNWQTAEDVVQETLLFINEKWESYQSDYSIFSWARGIVRRKSFEAIRALDREKPTELDRLDNYIDKSLSETWNQSTANCLQEKVRLLHQCVKHLPEKAQRILLEFYLHGNSYERISKNMEKSISQVKDSLFRLRNKLRSCVNAKSDDINDTKDDDAPNLEFLDEIYYSDEALSPERRETLVNKLKSEPNSGKWLHYALLEHAALSELARDLEATINQSTATPFEIDNRQLSVSPNAAFDVIPPQKQRTSLFRSRIIQSIAACVIIGIGLFWWIGKSHSPINSFAQIDSLVGKVSIIRNGTNPRVASLGDLLYPGDVLSTGSDSNTRIQLLHESSIMELSQLSDFRMDAPSTSTSDVRNHFYLKQGELVANVARQNPDNPMIITTPLVEIVVLGTRFKLNNSPASALLSVIEGRVRLTNRHSGISVIVKENEIYRVSEGEDKIVSVTNEVENDIMDGLIGKFSFDETPGDTILDTSPYNSSTKYLQKIIHPERSWTTGKHGTGFQFPTFQENQEELRVISVIDFPSAKVTDKLSLAMWLKPVRSNGLSQNESSRLLAVRDFSIGEDAGTGWFSGITAEANNNYRVFFYINDRKSNGNSRSNTFATLSVIPEGIWSHLGIVFDSGTVTYYINGELHRAGETKDSSIKSSRSGSLLIGPHKAPCFGVLDEVLIYNKALNANEIILLAQ